MGVEPQKCLVIEDSINGLNAARGAGMSCAAFLGTAHHPFDMSAASVSLSSFGPDGRALIHQFIENGGEGSK
ncbi:MAG: hypothetical protein FWH06_06530, partial [Oscillospiraceae bacterium]|nr:hypothetical protein [Oscillospiraceae bacterium]